MSWFGSREFFVSTPNPGILSMLNTFGRFERSFVLFLSKVMVQISGRKDSVGLHFCSSCFKREVPEVDLAYERDELRALSDIPANIKRELAKL